MALPVAAWRLAYTSGKWLALSGPTSLVIMPAPPAEMSEFATNLWRGTLETRTPDALFAFVNEVGIGSLTDFAAFFWDKHGLHGLFRGGVQLLDADGTLVAEGAEAVTWHEEQLDQDQTYTIQLAPVDGDLPRLPLVVGAALVSSVTLTTAKDQLLRLPDAESMGVLEKIPVLGVRRRKRPAPVPAESAEPAASEPQHEALPQPSAPEAAAGPPIAAAAAGVDADPESPSQPDAAAPEPEISDDADTMTFDPALLDGGDEEPSDPPQAEPQPRRQAEQAPEPHPMPQASQPFSAPPAQPEPGNQFARPPAPQPFGAPSQFQPGPQQPYAQPSPSGSRQAPVVVPGNFGEVDDDDSGTVFSTDLAAKQKPQPPQSTQDPQVLAVPCVNGHANPRGASSCRICSGPVDSSNPRLIRRPVLAAVVSNQGDGADVTSGIVVGRSPDGSRGPHGAYLMRVNSSGHDISRNHVLVTANEWNIVVTDLHSTNGTLIRPVGEPEFELRDGRSVTVEIGTELLLDDEIRLKIVPPRSN